MMQSSAVLKSSRSISGRQTVRGSASTAKTEKAQQMIFTVRSIRSTHGHQTAYGVIPVQMAVLITIIPPEDQD